MGKTVALFDLIKSMNKSEKRYFKLTAESSFEGRSKDYLLLYDEIERQEEYDDALLKELLSKQTKLKNFSQAKNYLLSALLKTLRNYHSSRNNKLRALELRLNAEILYSKGLYDMAWDELQKSKKTNYMNESFAQILSATYVERTMMERQYFLNFDDKLEELSEELMLLGDKLKSECEYGALNFKMIRLQKLYDKKRDPELIEKAKELLTSPLLTDVANASSFLSKMLFYLIHVTYAGMVNDIDHLLKYAQQAVDHLDEEPTMTKRSLSTHITMYNNLLYGHFYKGSYNKVLELLVGFRNIPTLYESSGMDLTAYTSNIFIRSHGFELGTYLKQKDLDTALKLIPELKEGLIEHKRFLNVPYTVLFHFSFAQVYQHAGESEKAKDELDEIQHHPQLRSIGTYYSASKLLNLLLLYDMGNYDMLTYQLRNTKLTLKRNDRYYTAQKECLKVLTKLIGQPEAKQLELFQQLDCILKDLEQDTSQKELLDLLEIQWWCTSKQQQLAS